MIRIEGIPIVAARLAAARKVKPITPRKPKVSTKMDGKTRPAA